MKKLIVTLIVIAAVAAGAGAYYMRRPGQTPDVATAAVTRGDIVDTVGATGALEAVTTVQVGTQVSGTVLQLNADFNSIVHRGQVIARLDPSLFQTQIEQAKANLVRAQAEVDRLKVTVDDARTKLRRSEELAARKLIATSELETAQVNVRSAGAQLQSAQAQMTQAQASLNQTDVNLEHTVIQAPIDGIVVSRNVDVGQTVAASFQSPTLFVIAADLTKMQVNANIDEADVGRIRPGQQVRFRVDAYPAEDFTGTVSQIRLQPIVVQNVVTYATVIDVPNPELKLKPGMTATVTIEIARRANVIRIPNAALRFRATTETFNMLGLAIPPELQRAGGAPAGAGGSADTAAAAGNAAGGTTGAPAASPAPGRAQAAGERGGGDRPASDISGATANRGAGGGTASMDPERRRQSEARLAQMSPEERQQAMQRMRERGTAVEGAPPAGSGPAAETAKPATARGAETIDALFGPLPTATSVGRVWLYVNNELKSVRLRLGITDGTYTELLGQELQPGAELVTGVTTGTTAQPAGAGGRSPLMPGGGRGGGPPH